MKNTIVSLLLTLFITSLWANPLHSKLKHSIIIDTDCDNSDLKAISLLLSHPGITIKAIYISNGKLQPEEGIRKIRHLLEEFQNDSIPIYTGKDYKPIGKNGSKILTDPSSTISISRILEYEKEPLTIVCLGPMTNLSMQLRGNQEIYKKIEEIIWYNQSTGPLNGFNYEYDIKSVEWIFNTGININTTSNLNNNSIFNATFFNICRQSDTPLAKFIYSNNLLHETGDPGQNSELAAIFLANPELFEMSVSKEKSSVCYNKKYNITAIKEVLNDMISGRYKSEHFVAFYGFPSNRELFVYDVRSIMDSAIFRYGIDEWKACVMTDEFHGHLGVFSIVGAKMGIYAREYFGIGTDLLEINSYAGSTPPFSCMNDGLQVSTGATLGQGTIHLINDSITKPQAVFTYQNKSVHISLKEMYLENLQAVIARGIRDYGLEKEGYWTLVRQTALKYWLEWDRDEILN